MILTQPINRAQKRKLSSFALFFLILFALIFTSYIQFASALPLEEELAIDRTLGILHRPWKINIIRVASLDYLRKQSQVTTGLPPYDQQIEHSNRLPANLYSRLSAPPEATRTAPAPTISTPTPEPTVSAPAPQPPPDTGGTEVGVTYPMVHLLPIQPLVFE